MTKEPKAETGDWLTRWKADLEAKGASIHSPYTDSPEDQRRKASGQVSQAAQEAWDYHHDIEAEMIERASSRTASIAIAGEVRTYTLPKAPADDPPAEDPADAAPGAVRPKLHAGMTDEERDQVVAGLLEAIDDGSLRKEIDAKIDPEWNAKYGEQSWNAALAQLGIIDPSSDKGVVGKRPDE